MALEKRGNSYRLRVQVDGQTIRRTFDHKPTKAEIQLAINEEMDKQEEEKQLTFEKAANQFCESKAVLSPSSLYGYYSIIRNLPKWFLNMDIYEIEQIHLNRLVSELSKKNAPKTVHNKHGFVYDVIHTFRPALLINTTLPRKEQKDFTIPTKEEVKKILEEVKGSKYEVAFRLACYGLRRSEILALTVADLNGNELTINKAYIRDRHNHYSIRKLNKTDAGTRKIIIDNDLAEMIVKQGYVVKCAPNTLNSELKRIQDKLGIDNFSLHKFRHFFATVMSEITDEKDIIALGGWKTADVMKNIYRHSMLEKEKQKKQDISDKFSNIVF